ncbi:hypothetical protein E3J62_03920 [candidate division TA06 bacterium]|uniref:Uncharacterized protein n=1 Tax=candidate division TA06 bacterium TaxID=2250710 RepID=A0A523UVC3_UNCT6|nr:MAG: hypothetical protein E3J62_03920 [candidate division TA06 bacterium]
MSDRAKMELFVGIKVTAALERHLDELNSSYAYLVAGKDEQSLRRITINDAEILGRSVEQATTVGSLSDIVKNLKSILSKFVPQYPLKDSEIRIYARGPKESF